MGWGHLKIFFPQTTEPEELIFTWKLSDIVQISACTNYGPWRSRLGTQKGELFLHLYIGKNLLKWNIRSISIKRGTNISCMIGIQIYSNEFSSPLQRGHNHKNRVGPFKYFLLMNHSTIKAQICTSASLNSAESILFSSLSLGVMRGHNRVKHFYICFNGESLWKSLQETTELKQFKFTCKMI
jgi:hypothetical protein